MAENRAARVVLDAQVQLTEEAMQRWKAQQRQALSTEVQGWLDSPHVCDAKTYEIPRQRMPDTRTDPQRHAEPVGRLWPVSQANPG